MVEGEGEGLSVRGMAGMRGRGEKEAEWAEVRGRSVRQDLHFSRVNHLMFSPL